MNATNILGVYGAGDARITAFRCFDHADHEATQFIAGKPARFEIDYQIIRPDLRERMQIMLVFKLDGIHDVCRIFQKDHLFSADEPEGALSLFLDELPLCAGAYAITTMLVREGYFDTPATRYFSINPDVYYVNAEHANIRVFGSGLYAGDGVVQPMRATMRRGERSAP